LVLLRPHPPAGEGLAGHTFTHPLAITHPYFPLEPGTTFIYEGKSDGMPTRSILEVTGDTKKIMGIETRVIRDTAYENDVMVEKTLDWFAQDDEGNVWYFGEDTTAYALNGAVASHGGSWEAGVRGAQPGIVMLAHPKVGDAYQQEFLRGSAEDRAAVLSLEESLCVPYKCFNNVQVTKDDTPLEPQYIEHKYYAPGVGQIGTVMVKGGVEESFLVKIIKN
jgi:hypothetical protein